MIKYINITLGFIAIIFLVSCGSSNKSLTNISDERIKNNEDYANNQFKTTINPDSIFAFYCESHSAQIKLKNVNWVSFPDGLSRCLYINGFNGDRNANMQIAAIISVVGYKFRDVFLESQYRGPEIFEALLSRAENPHKRTAHLYYARRMIKTIGDFSGEESDKYVKKVNGLPELVSVVAKGSDKGDPYWHKINFETIKKAWQDGKIVLKDYGEK